jgi:hypothetical protein
LHFGSELRRAGGLVLPDEMVRSALGRLSFTRQMGWIAAGDPAAARNVLAGLGRALLEGRGAMPAVGRRNDAAAGAAFLTWSETRHWLLVDQSGNQPLVLRNAPLLTFGRGAPARLGSAVRYPSHERSTPLLVDDAEHQLQMLRDPRSSAML